MTALILGLIMFIGMHSVRIVADDFRTRQIAKVGARTWRAMYAAVSLVGFVLIVIGYGKHLLDDLHRLLLIALAIGTDNRRCLCL